MALAVLEKSPLKVKAPVRRAANRQVRLPQPRPSRGPEASLSLESGYVPFKAFENVTALVAGQQGVARFVPHEPPWAGQGVGAGQGRDGGVKGYSAHHVGR